MFMQMIQGHVADREQVHQAFDAWMRDLAPGAQGWLGTTAGVTDDDELIAMVQFESPEAASRNSSRPEQHQWWTEASQLFDEDVVFHDSTDVDMMLDGISDRAEFVQVIQGRTGDPERLRTIGRTNEGTMREYRPDIIGGAAAVYEGDQVTQAVCFTNEQEAREGERKLPPPELDAVFSEQQDLFTDTRFLDIHEPWFYTPRR